MSAYEAERSAKIARNAERMRELGVDVLAAAVQPSNRKRRAPEEKKVTSMDAPRRTSGRARRAPTTYSDDAAFAAIEREVGSAAGGAVRRAYEPKPPPKESLRKSAWTADAADGAPRHPTKGHLVFKDRPDFTPNLTPAQMIRAGTFGGCYFHPRGGKPGVLNGGVCDIDPKEFPAAWFEGLEKRHYANRRYDCSINLYGVKAGQDQRYWEEHGWIDKRDPRGWFHWYCRFYRGRRLNDGEDDRQISRWKGVCGDKGRWKTNLINKILDANAVFDDSRISPVVRQTLLHWACEVRETDVLAMAKRRR